MKFNNEQLEAITSEESLVLVSAGAGSGKTRVLTERFIHLCEQKLHDASSKVGATVDEIVAITFTEKAAREMKDRIRKRLIQKEEEASSEEAKVFWQEQKEAIERAQVSTFHSFCQKLLSQYAMAADLLPRTTIIDEVEAKTKKREILREMLEERQILTYVRPLLQVMSMHSLMETIEDLHADIREFIVGEDAIQSLNLDHMLDVQCKAKEVRQHEMVKQCHEQISRCVEAFPALDDLTKAQRTHIERISDAYATYTLPDDPNAYMTFMSEIMPTKSDKRWAEKAPSLYELYVEHWKPLKDSWKDIGGEIHVDNMAKTYLEQVIALLKEFDHRYKETKEKAGFLDFTDLQQKAVALLSHNEIKESTKRQFKHIMIDEFQDTNRLQLEMLDRIDPDFQFIVGDQKQSIYRFRGANVSLMNEREELAEQSENAKAILMNANYRTTKPVIDAVNSLFSEVMVKTRTKFYETVYAPLEPHRPAEVDGEKRVELTVLEKDEERDIHTFDVLASRLVQMIETGTPHVQKEDKWVKPSWGDIAILIPARSHLLKLERALINKEIPYVINGGIGFFSRQEIIDFLTLLRWLNRPFEEVHLLALLRSPLCGLTIDDFFTLKQSLHENEQLYELIYDERRNEALPLHIKEVCTLVRTWLNRWIPFQIRESLQVILTDLFVETELRTSLLLQVNGLQKVKNVEKLIQMIDSTNLSDLETILSELDARIELSEKEGDAEVERINGDVVQIMTVHASKGLEFPIVCLPQLDRSIQTDKGSVRFHPDFGLVLQLKEEAEDIDGQPNVIETPGYALVKELASREAEEESKRLFYVAMTRARDYLYMIGEESSSTTNWLHLTEMALEKGNLAERLTRTSAHDDGGRTRSEQKPLIYCPPTLIKKESMPISLSVSEIMLFIKDPIEYFYRYVIGLPEITVNQNAAKKYAARGVIDPSKLGTLVHRACEFRDLGFDHELAIEEALVEEQLLHSHEYKKEMKQLMESYTDEMREALGETVANEWTFVTTIDEVEIVGEIDKIVLEDNAYHLIDFKTNNLKESGQELFEIYKPQLYLYKMAYEQETNNSVSSMSLYALRDKKQPLHTLPYQATEEAKVRQTIQLIRQLRQSDAPKTAYVEAKEKRYKLSR